MITVVSLNVNGLRSAMRKGLGEWLLKIDADIICFQEIKGHASDLEACLLEGYHSYFFSADKKGYSGVAIFSKKMPTKIHTGLGFALADTEGRYIQADFEGFSVASIYLPSGTSGDERQAQKFHFMHAFEPILSRLQTEKIPTILCGDFNIVRTAQDILHFKSNHTNSGCLPEERAWMNALIEEKKWVDTFREIHPDAIEYTWWSQRSKTARENNVGWRIDYQIATHHLKHKIKKSFVYKDTVFSDHAPVVTMYDL